MEQTPELTKALSELKRLTGLTMQITADTPKNDCCCPGADPLSLYCLS